MPAKPPPPPAPYYVRVHLRRLATHLREKLGRNATPIDAREWLVRSVHHPATDNPAPTAGAGRVCFGEYDYASPFRATAEFDLFSCDVDPADLLEASEVVGVWTLRQ